MSPSADDTPSIPELVDAALYSEDENLRWNAIRALRRLGSREVLDRAVKLCTSISSQKRALGADILGQLGTPKRTFPTESFDSILKLLSDESDEVLFSAILALHYVDSERATAHIVGFCDHQNNNVRYAVAVALGEIDHDETAIKVLLRLATDDDAKVRSWATFGLAQQCEADTPEIRILLADRLQDEDEDVRCEAIIGLARRRDARMAGYLKIMLQDDPHNLSVREAAARLLGMEDDSDTSAIDLLGALQRQQRWSRRE